MAFSSALSFSFSFSLALSFALASLSLIFACSFSDSGCSSTGRLKWPLDDQCLCDTTNVKGLAHEPVHRFPTTARSPRQQLFPRDTAKARADSISKSRMHSDEHAFRPKDSVLFLSLPSFPQAFLLVSLGMTRKRVRTILMVGLLGVGDQLPFGSR